MQGKRGAGSQAKTGGAHSRRLPGRAQVGHSVPKRQVRPALKCQRACASCPCLAPAAATRLHVCRVVHQLQQCRAGERGRDKHLQPVGELLSWRCVARAPGPPHALAAGSALCVWSLPLCRGLPAPAFRQPDRPTCSCCAMPSASSVSWMSWNTPCVHSRVMLWTLQARAALCGPLTNRQTGGRAHTHTLCLQGAAKAQGPGGAPWETGGAAAAAARCTAGGARWERHPPGAPSAGPAHRCPPRIRLRQASAGLATQVCRQSYYASTRQGRCASLTCACGSPSRPCRAAAASAARAPPAALPGCQPPPSPGSQHL